MERDNRMDDKLDELRDGPAPEELPPQGDPAPEEGQDPAGGRAKRDGSASRDLYLNVRVLVGMMAVFVLLFTFVARVIVVSGPSMESTLWERDLIFVWALGYEPKQGDIVVLTQEHYQEDSIIKRVIATGGQRLDIDYDAGTVYVDGVKLEEDYLGEKMREPSFVDHYDYPITVPEGCVFVMGDNRNNSSDSRYTSPAQSIGMVDQRRVLGRVLWILYPFDRFGGVAK